MRQQQQQRQKEGCPLAAAAPVAAAAALHGQLEPLQLPSRDRQMQDVLLGLHWQQTWVLAWGRPWGVAALGYWPPEAALFSPRLAAHWQAAQEAAAAVLRFGV